VVRYFERIHLPEVDSTQRYLKDLYAAQPDRPPTLVWATQQTAGYGRKGTPWLSPSGKSLPFSFLDRPQEALSLWSARIALSLYDAVALWCSAPLFLKWPNDLYAPSGKVAGILIEARWCGSTLEAAFAGIGLNVYHTPFPPDLSATTIESLGEPPPSMEAVLNAFESHYRQWLTALPTQVEATFTQRLWRKGPFRIQGERVEGSLIAWRADGTLLIETPTGPLSTEGHLVEVVWPPAWS
jgi:BirA family transcriptional regulator, biotin operon repressor / biotin---[acetyl-CoA-carboxylase] ligase